MSLAWMIGVANLDGSSTRQVGGVLLEAQLLTVEHTTLSSTDGHRNPGVVVTTQVNEVPVAIAIENQRV